MKYLLFLICLYSIGAQAQKRKIITDSTGHHGLYICDSIIKNVYYRDAKAFEAAMKLNGWRIPTIDEQRKIYEATFDKHLLRSTVIPPSIYFASESLPESKGRDTILNIGKMIGYQYESGSVVGGMNNEEDRHSVFLVKDF